MRSIRLSLVVYFLGLLCVALTVASLLLHDTAKRTLAAKEQAAEALAEARYEERAREARQRLDDRLLAQAKSLAGRVRPSYHWERIGTMQMHAAGEVALMGSLALPQHRLTSLINYLQVQRIQWGGKEKSKGSPRWSTSSRRSASSGARTSRKEGPAGPCLPAHSTSSGGRT